MNTQVIKETISTPLINISLKEKKIRIEGISMPEDPLAFYQEVFSWIDEHEVEMQNDVVLEINLDYFNSSSALILGDLMRKLVELGGSNRVLWQYLADDEDLKEAGEEYKVIIGNQVILEKV